MGEQATATIDRRERSFLAFFRSYAKTWIHGVSTAGLTAFGTLTIVHRWFAVLAISCYVLPPLVLYARQSGAPSDAGRTASALGESDSPDARADPNDGSQVERDGSADEPDDIEDRRTRDDREDSGDRTEFDDHDGRSDSDDRDETPRWTPVDSPTDAVLFDVALARSAAVAVGADGLVLASEGDEWRVTLEDGPGTNAETLYGIDGTDDGVAVWFAGDNGALGRLEVETGRHVDHSAPMDLTDNLTGVAVSGPGDDETILVINGSGEVLRGRYRDGDLAWEGPTKPGGGSSLSDVAVAGGVGYCCDTNDGVFRTEDGGRTFETVGLEDADGTLTALAPAGRDDCLAGDDGGVLHRYDGRTWTPERVGETALTGVARDGDRIAVCDDGGGVSERLEPSVDWDRIATSAPGPLRSVALEDDRGIAVGDGGTVLIERHRDDT